MNQNYPTSKGEIFSNTGLSLAQIRYWNKIQSHYTKLGFVFIEFDRNTSEEYIWKCFLESNQPIKEDLKQNLKGFDAEKLNASLAQNFSARDSYNNQYWSQLMDDVKWSGYYIPADDFHYFTNPQMLLELNHSFHLRNHFNVKEYLVQLKKDSILDINQSTPIALLGIWKYIEMYSHFLYACFENEGIENLPIFDWHSRNISLPKFKTYLPSRQLTLLFLLIVESGYNERFVKNKVDRLVKYAHPTIKKLYQKHENIVTNWIADRSDSLLTETIKNDFIECSKLDLKIIKVLEILDPKNRTHFQEFVPYNLNIRAFSKENSNLFKRIKTALSEISVLDALWFDSFGSGVKPRRYIPFHTATNYFTHIKWYEINESFIDDIEEVINYLPDEDKIKLDETTWQKWSSHLINVANNITPPILNWKLTNNETTPQWNVFSNKTASKFLKKYYEKQESLAEQKRRLKNLVYSLERLKSIEEIENLVAKSDPFLDPLIKGQWDMKVKQHKNSISSIQAYRERRKIELGIVQEGDTADYRTDIWLDEMIAIEKEIQSYIPFVKKAFTAALPIRKTVEFNDKRHNPSGVEFDPNTINDQNKWLRGEVMKTIRSKTKLGEIEQINAFCLDYSGSMDHHRMRNLFKVLYLLVLGLEDRKSYDAFHFFNSNFIEGQDFTEKFTRRSLLFQILSHVSEINEGVLRYGGFIGTNIGEGVLECHNRIHAFKEKISKKKPNSDFVCSMFVITDGEPSVGITDMDELNDFINEKRKDGNIAIKGIYIKSEEDENNFMADIFGKDQFVETVDFSEAVNKFVSIMTKTYKKQRQDKKWENRKQVVKGNN